MFFGLSRHFQHLVVCSTLECSTYDNQLIMAVIFIYFFCRGPSLWHWKLWTESTSRQLELVSHTYFAQKIWHWFVLLHNFDPNLG